MKRDVVPVVENACRNIQSELEIYLINTEGITDMSAL